MEIERKLNKNRRGFTLIELAVSMTILALAVGGGLKVASRNIEANRIQLTNDRLEYIMQTIEKYALEFNQIPCPADGSLAPNHTDFGIGGGTGAGTCTSENFTDVITPTTNLVTGAIPINNLGINPKYMFDGWNKKFTYVVDEDLTDTAGFAGADDGGIQIQDENDISLINSGAITTAAVLVISHGKNGHGAYRVKGAPVVRATQGANAGTHEEDNAHITNPATTYDSIFRLTPYRTQGDVFDDILDYRLKWQLN